MAGVTTCNPHKEEDEGYLAAEAGQKLTQNPYPRGTIRYEQWRRGWQIRIDATKRQEDEGYLAATAGVALTGNPHPRGTIRYSEWRRGWRIRTDEVERALRLGRAPADDLQA